MQSKSLQEQRHVWPAIDCTSNMLRARIRWQLGWSSLALWTSIQVACAHAMILWAPMAEHRATWRATPRMTRRHKWLQFGPCPVTRSREEYPCNNTCYILNQFPKFWCKKCCFIKANSPAQIMVYYLHSDSRSALPLSQINHLWLSQKIWASSLLQCLAYFALCPRACLPQEIRSVRKQEAIFLRQNLALLKLFMLSLFVVHFRR